MDASTLDSYVGQLKSKGASPEEIKAFVTSNDPGGPAVAPAQPGFVAGMVQNIAQGIASPFLRVASNVQAGTKMIGNLGQPDFGAAADKQITADAATKGSDYGYLGNATSFGDNPNAHPYQNAADMLGVGLNLASFVVPVGEAAKGAEVAADAGKGVLAKGAGMAVKAAKSVTGSAAKTFGAMQGGATAAGDIAQGKDAGQATVEGLLSGAGAALTIGLLNGAGNVVGSFAKTLSKTKMGAAVQQSIQDMLGGLSSLLPSATEKANSADFRTEVNALSEQLAQTKKNILDFTTSKDNGMFNPKGTDEKVFQQMGNQISSAVRGMYNTTRSQFSKVMNSGFQLTADHAQGFLNTMNEYTKYANLSPEQALSQARQAGDAEFADTLQKIMSEGGQEANDFSSKLGDFMSQMKAKFQGPLLAGKGVDIKTFDSWMHFQPVAGNPTEKAIMARVKDSLYQSYEDAMKATKPELSAQWSQARQTFQTQSSILNKTFSKIFRGQTGDITSSDQLAEKFISSDIVKTPSEMEEVSNLLGKTGMAGFQKILVQKLFGNASREFKQAIGVGSPEALTKASAAAAKVFTDFASKVDKVNGDKAQLLTANQLAFIRDAARTIGGSMDDFTKGAVKSIGGDEAKFGQLYDLTMRGGGKLYDLTKNPSQFAEQLLTMPLEDIQAAKQVFSNKTVDINGEQVKQWDLVTANALQKIAAQSKTFFQSGFTDKDAEKFINSIGNLGGGNKDQIMKELFGDNPGVSEGLSQLYKLVDLAKNPPKGGVSASTVAHGAAAFIFGMSGHPILSLSSTRHVITDVVGSKSESQFEQELLSQFEKSGKLKLGKMSKFTSTLSSILKNYMTLQVAGRGGAAAGQAAGEGVESLNQ